MLDRLDRRDERAYIDSVKATVQQEAKSFCATYNVKDRLNLAPISSMLFEASLAADLARKSPMVRDITRVMRNPMVERLAGIPIMGPIINEVQFGQQVIEKAAEELLEPMNLALQLHNLVNKVVSQVDGLYPNKEINENPRLAQVIEQTNFKNKVSTLSQSLLDLTGSADPNAIMRAANLLSSYHCNPDVSDDERKKAIENALEQIDLSSDAT